MFELKHILRDGSRRAGEIVETFGISRVTLKNAYEREAGKILRLGRARRTRYAARQILAGLQTDEFPVFRVDEHGAIQAAGTLITLVASESVWLPDETILAGLPREMHDAAPRGFLGRSFAHRNAELGLPGDVTQWSDNHALIALSRRGEDMPGNLVIGRESFNRFQELRHPRSTKEDFPALSAAASAGEHRGSSAGGERPKFTALVEGQHRIVKYATKESDNARRWQDLLMLEHIALETLREARITTAETHLVDIGNLRCLVVTRFDRVGVSGRRAAVTLAAASIDMNDSWADAAEKLRKRGEITDEDFRNIALLDAFGTLIANTDRHHFNLMLFPMDGAYSLAPAFDQLPMAYAPPASGILPNSAVAEPRPAVNTLAVWDEARELARAFWKRAEDQPLTDRMRAIVKVHASR
ncbi:MAG: HipA domain-containing protein [Woeseiaceae bacterium]|nr:HipA domain-containing protein [Woeseiaceae bacterium]